MYKYLGDYFYFILQRESIIRKVILYFLTRKYNIKKAPTRMQGRVRAYASIKVRIGSVRSCNLWLCPKCQTLPVRLLREQESNLRPCRL